MGDDAVEEKDQTAKTEGRAAEADKKHRRQPLRADGSGEDSQRRLFPPSRSATVLVSFF